MDYSHEFPQEPEIAYLNHAAVAPWPLRTTEAVKAFADENLRAGARDYPRWLKVEESLRGRLRDLINAPSQEDIALVKNTSEALSFVAYGLDWQPGDNIVTTGEEFPSNRIVWESLAARGVKLRAVDLRGAAQPEQALIDAIDGDTRMVAVSSVQYGSGLRLDPFVLGATCRRRNVLFCLDAIQSLGVVPMDVEACEVDFLAADGHKWMLGPEGLGLFYCRAEWRERLRLHEYGWHMVEPLADYEQAEWRVHAGARRFECGSPNMLAIHALERSLSLLQEVGITGVERAVEERVAFLSEALLADPEIEFLTPTTRERRAGIITFRHARLPSPRLHQYLSSEGVVCAMRAGGIRLSPHFYTPFAALERTTELIARCLRA